MRIDTLEILRCPFCGGRLELVESSFHRRDGEEIADGILGCHCCVFPVVAGIPVIHLNPAAVAAREQIEEGHPDRAARTMFALDDDAQAHLVAEATCHAVGGAALQGRGRAIDVCGGSGHLTRTLLDVSLSAPVLADLYFAKLWLARRFTAPGCEPVCCDGNAPLPFVNGAFGFVVCSDAFHYIWTKRLLASEMMRIAASDGTVVVTHAHNANRWNPSAGMPLPPDAYRDLFDAMAPRVFAESRLLNEIVAGGPLDLSTPHTAETLDADLALTIVASRRDEVFRAYRLQTPSDARGEFRVNPLYAVEPGGGRTQLRLRFPSADYEDEYGAARLYLADEVTVDAATLAALPARRLPPALAELARRRVVLDLPSHYY
jgi:SAM-dependent methyltransferase